MPSSNPPAIPHQTLGQVFLRFLRFGGLAWGGPVAQIAMLKRELVEEERWISPDQFNRAYAVYQVLPGPEAHELCVYFGSLARGRMGGLLAGLGFMLPGFLLMFALTWAYVNVGLGAPGVAATFAGIQAGVIALIVRAVHRIGTHALVDVPAWIVALGAFGASLAGLHFALALLLSGVVYVVLRRGVRTACLLASLAVVLVAAAPPDAAVLFGSGLRCGLLTFGGAYTAIPYLQHDAVVLGGWLSQEQFLDGIALGGVLPAPLIIFSTFVGYLAGGPFGACAMTAGIFLPAFAFTLLGHQHFERLVHHPRLRSFLTGVTAGVVGLIAATTVTLGRGVLDGWRALLVFAACLALVYVWRAKAAVAGIIGLAGLGGYLLFT